MGIGGETLSVSGEPLGWHQPCGNNNNRDQTRSIGHGGTIAMMVMTQQDTEWGQNIVPIHAPTAAHKYDSFFLFSFSLTCYPPLAHKAMCGYDFLVDNTRYVFSCLDEFNTYHFFAHGGLLMVIVSEYSLRLFIG
jgi:hypothetical protein